MEKGSRYKSDPSLEETQAARDEDVSLEETQAAAGADLSLEQTQAAAGADLSLEQTQAAAGADVSLERTQAAGGADVSLEQTQAAAGADVSLEETRAAAGADVPGPGRKLASGAGTSITRATTLGRYVVLNLLGRGGMGEVYTAYDPDLDRKVALKVIRPAHGRASGAMARARLLREAKAMAKLSHPNVISVFDVGTVDGDVYVAMEYVEGNDVRGWLEDGPRGYREVLDVFSAAARGLAAAHREGMIHRDFKPDNVLVGRDGRVRVIDFGLVRHEGDKRSDTAGAAEGATGARRADGEPSDTTTRAGALMGTPAYMAPEQVDGRPADARTDQFNFAASLYEALYDVRPFSIKSLAELVNRGPPRAPPSQSGVPEWVTAAVMRGLEADPERRFASMEAMLEALEAPRRRRVGWIALAALALLVSAGGGVVAAYAIGGEPPCSDLKAELRGVWDGARRAEVRSALLSADVPHAKAVWSRVESLLDRYGASWTRARVATCRATVEETKSEEILSRRAACLDRRRRHLDATVTVLAGGGESMLDHAVQAAASLPAIDDCANTTRLLATPGLVALPEVDGLIARARALETAGSYQESHDVAARATSKARAADSLAHEALALLALGTAERQLGEAEKGIETLFAAVRAASRTNAPDVEAKAWVEIVAVTLTDLRRPDEAARWIEHSRVALEAAGGDARLEARLRLGRGHIEFLHERYDGALADYRAAAALAARAYGDDDWRVARSLNMVGSTLRKKGRYQEAVRAHRDALAAIEAQLGAEHPDLTPTLNSLAITLTRLGLFDEAKAAYDRTVAIHRAARGDAHPRLATSLLNLGILHARLGAYDRAEALVRESLAIRERTLAPDHPKIPKTRASLAWVLRERGDLDAASAVLREVIAGSEAIRGAGHPDTAKVRSDYCSVLRRMGQLIAAKRACEEAITVLEDSGEIDSLADALISAGRTELELGRLRTATNRLDRAHALLEDVSEPTAEIAASTFALARAIAALNPEDPRASELAERAREVLTALPPGSQTELPDVEAWLARRKRAQD